MNGSGQWAVTDYFPYKDTKRFEMDTLPDAVSMNDMYEVVQARRHDMRAGYQLARTTRDIVDYHGTEYPRGKLLMVEGYFNLAYDPKDPARRLGLIPAGSWKAIM